MRMMLRCANDKRWPCGVRVVGQRCPGMLGTASPIHLLYAHILRHHLVRALRCTLCADPMCDPVRSQGENLRSLVHKSMIRADETLYLLADAIRWVCIGDALSNRSHRDAENMHQRVHGKSSLWEELQRMEVGCTHVHASRENPSIAGLQSPPLVLFT